MRDYPEFPLPEHFRWQECQTHEHTWLVMYGPCEVASYSREGDRWCVRVGILWAESVQRQAWAESASQARYWCVKWVAREAPQIAITRPTALRQWGPLYLGSMGAEPGVTPPASTWTPDQESARRRGRKRRAPRTDQTP